MSSMNASASIKRIVVLGGGFGGVYTARHLEHLFGHDSDVEIVLVSRDNFLLMTPLLFEVFSGTLELRHCSFPVRAFLRTTRFVEAAVESIDLERRVVHLGAAGESGELAYDQLVLALGARTNRAMIPGSEHAFTFKTLADALLLRNYVIERFERADVETDPQRKRRQLTFVIIGGGLVGVELFGELTALVDGITPLYKHLSRDEVRFFLLQAPTASCRKSTRNSPVMEPGCSLSGAGRISAYTMTSQTKITEMIEKSLLELDFASLARRTFTPSPAAWEDQSLYFLLLDRFSDGREKDGYRDNSDRPAQTGTTPL